MDSKALTKIQSVALIAIIIVAAVGGGIAYVLLNTNKQAWEPIRIGVCADLDAPDGKSIWQAVTLAAEQVNAEGGVLGRNMTVIAEDDDTETTLDISTATNALTKLITVDKADFIVAYMGLLAMPLQDICAQQKKLVISAFSNSIEESQRVLGNYDKYKYFFSMCPNITSVRDGNLDALLTLRNYTGFNKVAYLDQDVSAFQQFRDSLCESLTEHGFDIVYKNSATWLTTDFSSYFSAIEKSGAEILTGGIFGSACVSFVKEYYNRQSPFVVWGQIMEAQRGNFWELTEGKCQSISFAGMPTIAGYPLTNKTLEAKETYFQRWHDTITMAGTFAYDAVRFILPDAIVRAGTTETEAVIKTLETTNVEAASARHFMFTSSHGVFVGEAGPNIPSADYMLVCLFQWQNLTQVPVYPQEIMEGAGATYKYPPWQGPWSNTQSP